VCNIEWQVPQPENTPTVWVTLEFAVTGAVLRISDAAPDAEQRTCLATYDFPLNEPVLPRQISSYTASAIPISDDSAFADQPNTASVTEIVASTQSPLTDGVPTSGEQRPASVALVPTTATKPVVGSRALCSEVDSTCPFHDVVMVRSLLRCDFTSRCIDGRQIGTTRIAHGLHG